MILSYNWLKELVDLSVSPSDLVEILTMLGLEVEETIQYVPSLENVLIGEVLECSRIEGTDHLSITKTSVGGESHSIVCGAPNVRAGLKVVIMLPGSKTADGKAIRKTKIRGHESFGMLASESELGLYSESDGILVGDSSWIVGANATDYINLADTTFDVEITPNRPDFLSHIGVARDIAAKLKLEWKNPIFSLRESNESVSSRIGVEIKATEACPRYAARIVTGIKIAPSPYEMRLRLSRCGNRPISNIVDVTNYLMLLYGHPLHAFDSRFVEGNKIVVRYAESGEKFTTLDAKEYSLKNNDLLIADSKRGIALAGIMGGQNSEIREDTENVIIECAYFDPVHIRRTAKTLGMGTDSSRRFERGMDPNTIPTVVDAAASLMQSLGGGNVLSGRVDIYPKEIKPPQIKLRTSRVKSVVGVEINSVEINDILNRLGCSVKFEKSESTSFEVIPPSFRPDLHKEIDLVEEVIRIYGYDQIPTAPSSRVPLERRQDEVISLRRKVVDVMASLGFLEALSVSMYTPDARRDPPNMPAGVVVANPVTNDMKLLHGSILPSLVRAASANWQRGDRNLRLFEVAKVFQQGKPDDPQTWERLVLTGLMTGQSYPQSWAHPAHSQDFFDLKGVLEVLITKISLDNLEIFCYDIESDELVSGELRFSGEICGKWGLWPTKIMAKLDLDSSVGWFEVDLALLAKHRAKTLKYAPLPRFPIAWRDLAVMIDAGIPSASLVSTIQKSGGTNLDHIEPLDIFKSDKLGADKKSIAFRLEFSHPERSLEAEEIDGWMAQILNSLKSEHNAVLR